MDIKKLLLNSLLSLPTLFELLIILVFFLIFPTTFNLLLLICFFAYIAYRQTIIYKTSKSLLETEPESKNTSPMQAAYYSSSFSKVVDFGEYPRPVLTGQDQLLIEVHAAALNPVDYKFLFSKIPFYRWVVFPDLGIGKEFCGKVIQIGSKVSKFKEGDIVYGFSSTGGVQEYCLTKEKWIELKPDNLTEIQAASLPLAGCTVYQALSWFFNYNNNSDFNDTNLTGKIVLVIGASGGTGHLAVQIARALGAQEVYGTCSQGNVDLVRGFGVCDNVFAYDDENFEHELENNFRSSLGENKIDLIIDTVSSFKDGDIGSLYKKYLKPEEGKYVALGGKNPFWTMIGTFCSFFPKFSSMLENKTEHIHFLDRNKETTLEGLNTMALQGKINPIVNKISFDQVAIEDAVKQLKSRRTRGKLVCSITE